MNKNAWEWFIVSQVARLQQEVSGSLHSRNETAFNGQTKYLEKLTSDLHMLAHVATVAFTRYPDGFQWLLQTYMFDLLESAQAVESLAKNGLYNASKRELRYMLEAAVKYIYIDQHAEADTPHNERLDLVADNSVVPRSSVRSIDNTTLRMVNPAEFRQAVHSAFGALSRYTHLSREALIERQRKLADGELVGFESVSTLSRFNSTVYQIYDLVISLIFEGIGPSFTGDVFIQYLDYERDWKFHQGKFVKAISKHFDYKLERQRLLGEIDPQEDANDKGTQ